MRRTTPTVMLVLALTACSGPRSSSEPEPTPAGASEASASPEESQSPRPPRPPSYAGEEVRGWPTTSRNRAGAYSWDGATCAGGSCVMGFMHNGYGSGDVTFHIVRARGASPVDEGWTTTTVAGHDALHRRSGAREDWLVEIHGTTVAIDLTTRRGTRQVEQDEAHAIVASMRAQRRSTRLGFRLVFRLTTNDWDSG